MLRDIHIHPVLNGYIVEVGCQKLVYETLDTLLGDLAAYLQDPELVEKNYRATGLNAKWTLNDQPREATGYNITYTGPDNATVSANS